MIQGLKGCVLEPSQWEGGVVGLQMEGANKRLVMSSYKG